MELILVAGARPNFMKVAPLVEELHRRKPEVEAAGSSLELLLVHTGQHYDERMSQAIFDDLGLPRPDINLEVGSGSHAEQTARVMLAFERILLQEGPDLVVVVGDVNSTLACALTARKLGIQVAHVEAGLRSRDMSMPEEINRRVADILCDYLFTTEPEARENLVQEGVDPDKIFFVGNVMIDTLFKQLRRIEEDHLTLPVSTHFKRLLPRYSVLTLHRPSNVDDAAILKPMLEVLHEISQELPVLFPVHPRTAQKIGEYGLGHLLHPFKPDGGEARSGGVYTTEPLGYLEMLNLTRHARLVLTDSGGLQEETTALGVPCLTLRENTERPITLEVGTNVLVGTNPQRIREEARRALSAEGSRGRIPEKWDGRAAQRIVEIILRGKMGQEGGKCTSSS